MNKVEFCFNDVKFFVQCNNDDKMKDIIAKFLSKSGQTKNSVFFLYNGRIINDELVFNKCANSLDRSRNYMNVIVLESQGLNDESVNLIKSKYIICPKCNKHAYISIKDFKLSIVDCESDHKTRNLQINEFSKTQYVDQSKIKCDKCQNSKSGAPNNKFFVCNTCKKNLCPRCKNEHDNSHLEHIKDYDENQFYCKIHNKPYVCYCSDCKIDLCDICQKEHKDSLDDEIDDLELDISPEDKYVFGQDHNFLFYDNITPNIEIIRNNELKDTKEKIYQVKLIIDKMINQLNQLNKNLNSYFEIYNDIISNFDITKRNYSVIQNINTVKKFNDNFLGYLTEIIKDNNLKSQFINILSLQSKMEFRAFNKDIQTDKNEIILENNNFNTNDTNNNIQNYNPSDFKYTKFKINKIKMLKKYNTKNEVEKLLILKDGRILTLQAYHDDTEEINYKLSVYSEANGFVCDINIDFDYVNEFYLMYDGNVLIDVPKDKTIIMEVTKNNIKKIWVSEKKSKTIKKLSNKIFLANIITKSAGKIKVITEEELYTYNKRKLIFYKNISKLYKDKCIENICHIEDTEYALYVNQKGKIFGTNDFLIFYDMKYEREIKKLKVGTGKNRYEMLLIKKDTLIIEGNENIILIDPKTRTTKKIIELDFVFDDIFTLNGKIFLYKMKKSLEQYELEDSVTIKLKEVNNEIKYDIISKYPGNKLITYYNKNIYIYG